VLRIVITRPIVASGESLGYLPGDLTEELSDLSGVILLDRAGYDIPREVRQAWLPRMKAMYTSVFTE
jgi:hypothetical protein